MHVHTCVLVHIYMGAHVCVHKMLPFIKSLERNIRSWAFYQYKQCNDGCVFIIDKFLCINFG